MRTLSMSRRWAAIVCSVWCVCSAPSGCATAKATAERRQKKSEQVEGGSKASPEMRTADDIPNEYPNDNERGPFDESPMGIDAYRVYTQQMGEDGTIQQGAKRRGAAKKPKGKKSKKGKAHARHHKSGPAEPAKPEDLIPPKTAKPESKGSTKPTKRNGKESRP